MAALISIDRICTALKEVSGRLAAPDRDQVLTLLASTPPACRSLCLAPIQMNGPAIEVWSDTIYAPRPQDASAPEQASAETLEPVGWMCFLRASSFGGQFSTLADLVDAFHFFAPLLPAILGRLEASLAEQIRALQRLRPAVGSELYGDEITFVPPAAFGAAKPDQIQANAMSPLDSPPEGYDRFPFAALGKTRATVVVLYGSATKVDPDPAMGLTRTR